MHHAVTPIDTLSPETRETLLRLARKALKEAVEHGRHLPVPNEVEPSLRERKGTFVTLTIAKQLRGCIGNIYPEFPLAEAITTNAYRAAREDPRFAPVNRAELGSIEVEISVLTEPMPLQFATADELLTRLRPHVDGVVLKVGSRRSTFLPQVWEKLPRPAEFMAQLSTKAGLSPEGWRDPTAQIYVYQVESFGETPLDEPVAH